MLAAVAILVEKTLRSQKVAVASECHFRRGLLHPRSELVVVMAWLDFRARPLSEIVITIELVLSDFYSPLGRHPNQPVFGNRGFHGGLEGRHDHRRGDDPVHQLHRRDDDAAPASADQRGQQHFHRRHPVLVADDGTGRRGDRRRLCHGHPDQLRPLRARGAQVIREREGRYGPAKDARASPWLERHRVLCATLATFASKRSLLFGVN